MKGIDIEKIFQDSYAEQWKLSLDAMIAHLRSLEQHEAEKVLSDFLHQGYLKLNLFIQLQYLIQNPEAEYTLTDDTHNNH